jgi:hypothetical protein
MIDVEFWRWLHGTWARFLVPFYFAQEDFHGGHQTIVVWWFGRPRWEVYDWGPEVGAADLDDKLSPLLMGSRECYSRIQNCADAGICKLVGRYRTHEQARARIVR